MATSIRTKGLQKKLAKLLSNINDRDTFLKLGFFVIKTIKNRTRGKGQGVRSAGARPKKLKKVSKKWADYRKTVSRHPEAANGRNSNLTFKGTLLDSMVIRSATKKGVFIGFKSKKEEDKAEGQAKQGRVFMNLSNAEIVNATEFLKKQILKK